MTDQVRDASVLRERRQTKEDLLQTLAHLGGKLSAEEDVVFSGTKFVLPESSTLGSAIDFLTEKQHEDEREMSFSRTFDFRPWDGAIATMRALKKAFGMATQRGVPGMFGESPPALITVKTGPDEEEQAPWGGLAVGHLPGMTFYAGQTRHEELGLLFRLSAEGPRKYRFHVEGIFRLVQEELEANSIYRGKAFDGQADPQFLDLDGVDRSKVVYSDEVLTQLEANVWSLIRWPQHMRDLGLPLKRAVLFEGPYGTGKTLAAYLTAREAVDNGWTFIYCRPARDDLQEVMSTARLYQPSVVFFEDVDVIADPTSEDSDAVTKLLDIFDGVQSKGTEIVAILTTNHADRIHKGMVRPGRLDAVIHIGSLDLDGVKRLTQSIVPKDRLATEVDWLQFFKECEDFMPAFVKEAVDRAMRYSLARNNGVLGDITTEDLVAAARGLRPQLELMQSASDDAARRTIDGAIAAAVRQSMHRAEFVDHDGDTRFFLETAD